MNYLMNVICISLTIQPMQVNQHPGRFKNRTLYELKPPFYRRILPVPEPGSGHGLMPIGPQNGGARHTVTPVLRSIVVVNSDGSTYDRIGLGWSISRTFHFSRECENEFNFSREMREVREI